MIIIFYLGLARSGTTLLLNLLYETKEFSSFKYSDMPFILLPNYNKRNKKDKYISRIHGDEIKININSPKHLMRYFGNIF